MGGYDLAPQVGLQKALLSAQFDLPILFRFHSQSWSLISLTNDPAVIPFQGTRQPHALPYVTVATCLTNHTLVHHHEELLFCCIYYITVILETQVLFESNYRYVPSLSLIFSTNNHFIMIKLQKHCLHIDTIFIK